MAKIDLDLEGVPEFHKVLEEKTNVIAVKRAVRKSGQSLNRRMVREASFRGHYDYKGRFIKPTGETKRSIKMEINVSELGVKVFPQTEYSSYLEYGTRRMDAQPFVRPAFLYEKIRFIERLTKLVK